MSTLRSHQSLIFVGLFSLVACGTTPGSSPNTGSGGITGSGGTSGNAGNGAGGTANGGSSSAGKAGTNAGGGSANVNCSGEFAGAELMFESPSPNITFNSPSITGDELELFYTVTDTDQKTDLFLVTRRTNKQVLFGVGTPISELNAACTGLLRTLDVSNDGLRAYFSCPADAIAEVKFAERATRDAAFVVKGSVGNAYGSIAVDTEELTLYSNGSIPGSTQRAPLRQATRSHVWESFGELAEVPGLLTVDLITPDPSPDGLQLFVSTSEYGLGVAKRENKTSPFMAPVWLSFPTLNSPGAFSSSISADCRTLYFIGRSSSSTPAWGMYRARR